MIYCIMYSYIYVKKRIIKWVTRKIILEMYQFFIPFPDFSETVICINAK